MNLRYSAHPDSILNHIASEFSFESFCCCCVLAAFFFWVIRAIVVYAPVERSKPDDWKKKKKHPDPSHARLVLGLISEQGQQDEICQQANATWLYRITLHLSKFTYKCWVPMRTTSSSSLESPSMIMVHSSITSARLNPTRLKILTSWFFCSCWPFPSIAQKQQLSFTVGGFFNMHEFDSIFQMNDEFL